jgi:moderate conductance mechanosensitive channel
MNLHLTATLAGLFAEGRFLGKVLDEWGSDAQEFVRARLPHLLVVALIAFILARLLRIITRHMVRAAERNAIGAGRTAQVKTIAGVIRATGLAIIGIIAGLQILDALGFNLGPLLASAGIAGVAIGLAAQNIVRDVLNGVLILVEGQFSVGDTVRLAGITGVVEEMTLRRTAVRDVDGTLYVIPNSQITTVANLSAGYSVSTVNVSADFSADPDRITQLLREIAMEVRSDEAFRDLFVEDPKVLGMDAIKGSQLTFPVIFKTHANQQYAPVREFQRRVRLAFEQNGILPGDPGRVFQAFDGKESRGGAVRNHSHDESASAHDPTAVKPHEGNPFSGE